MLLRDRFHHLTDIELRSLALYAGMTGGVLMTSDSLHELSAERLELLAFLLNAQQGSCTYPLSGANLPDSETGVCDPVLVQVCQPDSAQPDALTAVFVFNTGESTVQRSYLLEKLGLPAMAWIFDWHDKTTTGRAVDHIDVNLNAHEGRLMFIHTEPFNPPPKELA